MTDSPKTAAYWLDKAVQYEAEGNGKSAALALKRAISLDEQEHASDGPKSLPRA